MLEVSQQQSASSQNADLQDDRRGEVPVESATSQAITDEDTTPPSVSPDSDGQPTTADASALNSRSNDSSGNVSEAGDSETNDAQSTQSAAVRSRMAQPDTGRKKVEERKSSSASRTKGEINFDDLKFDLEKDAPFKEDLLGDAIRGLDGTKVRLRGYILPSTLFSETNISQFVLVRDNQECCFGPGAALFDCVMVQMVPGKTTDFVTRPVTVEGKFVVDTESYRYPPGLSPTGATHMAVFRIEGNAVQ